MYRRVISFLILLVISSSAVANKKTATNTIGVKAVKVRIAELYDVFNLAGQCRDDNSRDYYANVAGKVEKVSVQQGEAVNKGDILFIIDKDIAEAAKTRAIALLNIKQEDYNRKEALFAKKFVSIEEHKRSKSELEDAKFNYSKALKNYSDMIITAPFSGKIGVIKSKVGDEVKLGYYLFSITAAEGEKSIFIELPESLSGKVSTDIEVLIENKIKSKISAISQYLSNEGTITAKIILPYDKKILHNSYVDVLLIIKPHKNLAIPEECIQRNNQGNFIYKIDNNVVKQIYVKTGSRTKGLIEIISNDIQEGNLVVAQGMTKINDGSTVKILEEDKPILP